MNGKIKTLADIRRVVAFGDSVTFGLSASSPDRCWASLTAQMLEKWKGGPVELINKGEKGTWQNSRKYFFRSFGF